MTPSPNPILENIDEAHRLLSPEARQALEQAHGIVAAQSNPIAAGIAPQATPSPNNTQLAPRPLAAPGGGAPTLPPSNPTAQSHTVELNRLEGSKSGIGQIQSPFARIPLQIADAIGSTFLPRLTTMLPGTALHHQALLHGAERTVANDQGQAAAEAENRLKAAQAVNQENQPELREATRQLNVAKLGETTEHNRATEAQQQANNATREATAKGKVESYLAKNGMKLDDNGAPVAMAYDDLPQPLKDLHDYRAAASELAAANADYKKAQKENIPVQMDLARRRLESAQQAHAIAERRLTLSEEQTAGRLHGTTPGGEPLPGAMITEDNQPVGSAFQQNVRPTGTERNKADLAKSAADQISDMKGIVSKRPDVFGPAAGRKTDFTVWLGSQDPDASRFRAARTIAADHLAGVFGGRSEAALQALDAAIGRFKDDPKAILSGLDQISHGNYNFIKAGTVRSVGSTAGAAAGNGKPAQTVRYESSGRIYNIPATEEGDFLKDHKGAVKK